MGQERKSNLKKMMVLALYNSNLMVCVKTHKMAIEGRNKEVKFHLPNHFGLLLFLFSYILQSAVEMF